ncbi:Coiled-coil domain-containing protein 77 [Allomyces arbusculus]|nr:Coiled-coil domain-containing protein 77 [Allomyces arbusculus]
MATTTTTRATTAVAGSTQDVQVNLDRLPLSEDLLKYYKQRIEHNEAELQSYIAALDAIKASHEEHHALTRELQQRNDEIQSLQAALVEAQGEVLSERRQLLQVLAENDELRLQELKDRKKIRYLLALCGQHAASNSGALGPDVTYFKPAVEPRLVRPRAKSGAPAAAAGSKRSAGKPPGKPAVAWAPSPTPTPPPLPRKTAQGEPEKLAHASDTAATDPDDVRLAEAATEAAQPGHEPGMTLADENAVLRLQVQALRAQLAEQRQLHDDAARAWRHEAQVRHDEHALRTRADADKMQHLGDQVAQLQAFLRDNTREVLAIRRAYLINERRLKEERVVLVDEVTQLRAKYAELRSRSEQVEKLVEMRITRRNEGLLHELRSQLAKYEEELRRSKLDGEQREAGNKKKIEVLQSKLDALRNSYKALKKRRDFEIEGFTNDILILRKQVRSLEAHIIKYGPLQDQEMAVLDVVKKTAGKAQRIQDEMVGLKRKIQGMEADLHSIPI